MTDGNSDISDISGMQGRRVVITGGGTGVGADLARGFAVAGAQVTIAGRRLEPLADVAASAPGIQAITADVTDEVSITSLFEQAGDADIVIANAGVADTAPFAKLSLAQWQASIDTNLTGVFLTLREGLRRLDGWGRLIVIASTAGLKGYPYVTHYTAAKHGAVGLVRALAREVARKPITVNAICPGFLDTEMTDRSVATITAKTDMDAETARATLAANNPQGRLIAPVEVTQTALWLCGPGSAGINGQAIAIAGGEV